MADRRARMLEGAAPIVGGLLFAALWSANSDFWLDDAFITFRYARNLADGLGPVFNPGEAVEGYSSFLWMLGSASAFALLEEAAALAAIKAAGLGLGLGILWRCWTFPSPVREAPGPRWLVLLLASDPVFVGNCGDGLETPLLMALLVECARVLARPPTTAAGALLGLWTALAAWTRPEAIPLLVVWPALVALFRRGAGLRWYGAFALASLPLVFGHLAWRLGFYGALFPNTFYAKATGDLLPRLIDGVEDAGAFTVFGVGSPPLALWIAIVLAVVATRALLRGASPETRLWLSGLWSIVLFRFGFDIWSGSEFMGTFRFLAPALPALFVLADEGRRHFPGSVRRWTALAGALALTAALYGNHLLIGTRTSYQQGLERAHVSLGRWLRQTQPADTWVAVGDAGAIPFFSGLPVIDLWGLSDPVISQLPGEYGNRPGVADYALGRRPGVIVVWSLSPVRQSDESLRLVPAQPFDREIAAHPVFRDRYRFLRELTFRPKGPDGSGYHLAVFGYRPNAVPRSEPTAPDAPR